MTYTEPHAGRCALVTIDVQNDFTQPGAPAEIPGTLERLPRMAELATAFRAAGRPVVHIVRLYREDGSNADACRRNAIEDGLRIVAPGSDGAELVDVLKPSPGIRLDADHLLAGEPQRLAASEWAIYKPRWDAFYRTPLDQHLRIHGVDTLVFCGCNFPNCPRASIYGASMHDFRIVVVSDVISGITPDGIRELEGIGVIAMTTAECLHWLGSATPA